MSIEELTNPQVEKPSLSEMIKKSIPNWKPSTESVPELETKPETKAKPKIARKPKADATLSVADDEETVRKRDILVSVSVLGELESYVGENVPASKIRTMKKGQLEVLYSAYEAKLGQEMTKDGMEAVVGTAVKAINWFVPLDDVEALKEDLLENKPLRRSLGRHCASVAERYGDFVAFSKVIYDIVKHIKFDEEIPIRDYHDESKERLKEMFEQPVNDRQSKE